MIEHRQASVHAFEEVQLVPLDAETPSTASQYPSLHVYQVCVSLLSPQQITLRVERPG